MWSRSALQEKLWSDRGATQGRDSLKKELITLKKVFGEGNESALILNGMTVQIREDRVRIDLFDPELRSEDTGPVLPKFLEGSEIKDPEFTKWLEKFREKIAEPSAADRATIQVERGFDPSAARFKIALLPVIGPQEDLHSTMVGEMIADRVAVTLRQLDMFDIVDYREPASEGALRGSDFSLRLRVLRMSSDLALTLLAHETQGQTVFWAEKRLIALADFGAEELACLVAEILDQIIAAILRKARDGDPERRLATRYALDGIDLMFRLDKPDIGQASISLRKAIEMDPRGPYMAFYAFQTLFRLEQSKGANLPELRDRADDLIARALEFDPHNPISRALATHVYSFLFRDFERADALIRPMASSPPDSPIYFHSLAALRLYTGRIEEARAAAQRAREMAKFNVYSYAFSTTLAMVNTVDNKLDAAIRQGEQVLAMHAGADRIYEPALRYLAAAYGLKGDAHQSARIVQLIRKQSPGFAPASLENPVYPVPSEFTRDVLRDGIGKAFSAMQEARTGHNH